MAAEPFERVSVRRSGADGGADANGAMSTLHLASVCAPREPCRMSANPQSFSLKPDEEEAAEGERKRVQMRVSVWPKIALRLCASAAAS